MMDTLYAILMSVATAIGGGFSGWFFTRKKYHTEVDANVIKNLASSFTLYKENIEYCEKTIKDLKDTIEEYKLKNDKLEKDLTELKERMFHIMEQVCINLACTMRKRSFDLFGNENTSKENIQEN